MSDIVETLRYLRKEYDKGNWRRYEEVRAALSEAADEIELVRQQLPPEMPGCTVRFSECPAGHGRLTATNWVDNGCPWCLLHEADRIITEALSRSSAQLDTVAADAFLSAVENRRKEPDSDRRDQ